MSSRMEVPIEPPTGPHLFGRFTTVALAGFMAVAVIGYFVGLADGVPNPGGIADEPLLQSKLGPLPIGDAKTIAAVRYAQIPEVAMGPTAAWQASEKSLPQQPYDLFAAIVPLEEDKEASSKTRASRRAFNGAPPVIPHAVESTNDAACYACHANGMRLAGLKASVMSHAFLANCTQCHGAPPPKPFDAQDSTVDSRFVGLTAPRAGKRAFPGAPPTIPHSQWMRENCTACHGGPNGWSGMESTHPWRTNCTQCHAPSAELDQAFPVDVVPMLPPIEVATSER